ncbi:hypothetical protein LGL55_14090 [Clostridium tagluense]|uniref:hypothetical protein n=1 Tax=Clostridium TaxID=1485 RepID=UPI0013E9618A|nr:MULTISPECIES: hypothetical protein [Clostridium]MBW9156828.1 hypothetical protein [Clostridium tagluense]MBZ9621999.1 hypothetical protein [Clostridium sp. FP2]MCB2312422.1 hypothetical protein [Clostridium tagluense]MCB2317097.1 hypothetical protein [Clostridium tagluense]MCB2321961.1 hypothetical protein [Clostridium tagluense]
MEINKISQLVKTISNGATQSTKGILGNDSTGDASSSFEALLNQIVNNSQNTTLNNAGTSIPNVNSKDNIVNGLDSVSLQSQKTEQLQQMVMQQMMQIMTKQDTNSSSSIGTVESEDSSNSLFPSTNSSNDMSKLLQTIVQEQTNTSTTNNKLDNSSQVNAILSKSNL